MNVIFATIASFFAQEFARPRHRRPDPLAYIQDPATLGVPVWFPTNPTPAQRALDAAQADLTSAMEAWYRRHLPDGDLRATIRTMHEAQWAVTSR